MCDASLTIKKRLMQNMKKSNAITKHVEITSRDCRGKKNLNNKLDINPHANVIIKYDN